MNPTRKLLLSAACAAAAATVSAQNLEPVTVRWDVTTASQTAASVAGVVSDNVAGFVDAADLIRSPQAGVEPGSGSFASSGWEATPTSQIVDDPMYFEFGLDLGAGVNSLLLSSVEFSSKVSQGGPFALQLFSSADNYQGPLGQLMAHLVPDNYQPWSLEFNLNVDAATANDVRFRIVQIDNQGVPLGSGDATPPSIMEIGFQQMQLSGVANVIPEPSTTALLGLGGLLFLGLRRKR